MSLLVCKSGHSLLKIKILSHYLLVSRDTQIHTQLLPAMHCVMHCTKILMGGTEAFYVIACPK